MSFARCLRPPRRSLLALPIQLPCQAAEGALWRDVSMSTPLLATMWVSMIIIAWLAGVEWWMIAIGAVVAVIGWLLERNRD